MKSKRLRLLLFALILTVSCASGQEPSFSLEGFDKMSVEEKRQLFGTPMTRKLDDPSQLLDLYVRGLKDSDQITQRKAVQSLGWFLLSLQDMRREGTPIPMDFSKLGELQQLLSAKLSSADAEIRGAAIQALVHTGAPNPQVEFALLSRLAQEPNDEIKAAVIDRLAVAGYDSNAFIQTVFNSLRGTSADVRNAAAKAVAEIKPTGALPRLSQALEQYPSQFVIDAIAAYGAEALPYVPQLERLAANEAVRGDLRDQARRAIEAIKNPQPQAQAKPKAKAVALVDASQPQTPPPPAPPAATPAPSTPVPTATPTPALPAPATERPAPVVERKAPVWPWLVGIAVLIAFVAFFAKRRG